MKLYEISADLGYEEAMVNLGYLYYKLATNNIVPFTHATTREVMDSDELYFQAASWVRRALFINENLPEA